MKICSLILTTLVFIITSNCFAQEREYAAVFIYSETDFYRWEIGFEEIFILKLVRSRENGKYLKMRKCYVSSDNASDPSKCKDIFSGRYLHQSVYANLSARLEEINKRTQQNVGIIASLTLLPISGALFVGGRNLILQGVRQSAKLLIPSAGVSWASATAFLLSSIFDFAIEERIKYLYMRGSGEMRANLNPYCRGENCGEKVLRPQLVINSSVDLEEQAVEIERLATEGNGYFRSKWQSHSHMCLNCFSIVFENKDHEFEDAEYDYRGEKEAIRSQPVNSNLYGIPTHRYDG
jgi:hypothetical protein